MRRNAIGPERTVKNRLLCTIAPAFLPQVLAPLLTANPGLGVELEECDNPQTQAVLLQGSYDAILFVAAAPVPQIVVERLIHAPNY